MTRRSKIAAGFAGLAAAGALMLPFSLSQGGGTVDVFVGSTPTPITAPTLANIWIAAGAGACAGGRSATAISYAAAASPDRRCGSIPQAYDALNAGDTACFADGTYTDADLSNSDASSQIDVVTPKTSGPDVVFDVCGNTGVSMASSSIDMREISYAKFRNLTFHDWYARGGAQHITFDAVTATCSFIRGADYITLQNSTMGNGACTSFWSARTNAATGWPQDDTDAATNVTIDNVLWRDVWSTTSADHTDSIAIDLVTGLTIKRLTMVGCENACLIFGNGVGNIGASNIVIENSAFACCYDAFKCAGSWCNQPGGNSVAFFQDNDPGPASVRFNSFSSINGNFKLTDATGADTRGSDFIVDSNVFDSDISSSCSKGVWLNNVSAGTACSGVNKVAANGWTDPPASCCTLGYGWDGTYNFNLTAGAGAVGYGNQSSFPSTDLAGNPRTTGTVDAGAYER